MTPIRSMVFAAFCASLICAAYVWFIRMPLPFPGFSILAAAGLAFFGTLTAVAWMPRHWVWTEAERLRHAFQAQHKISEYSAGSALDAITSTHERATKLRQSAKAMRKDVAGRVVMSADRLDAAAREIFYDPDRHKDLRGILVRSELIEDAAAAHAALRLRNKTQTENESRQSLILALDALDAAFDETDLRAARGLLTEVTVASEVAEALLKPRRALRTQTSNEPR